jgi:prepilin-type N-terminal cleavage/methylation domain-containing protein
MAPAVQTNRGYSLAELLVVLAIVGILAIAGVSMIGDRSAASVRSVMDEIEGTLASAHKLSMAGGTDVRIGTHGDWTAANPMILAYGNGTLPLPTIIANGQNQSESFRLAVSGASIGRDHLNAKVITNADSADWAAAAVGSDAISSIPPFNDASTGFSTVLGVPSQNLFQGGTTDNGVLISGTNKRFASTFFIQVTSMKNGASVPGGPLGLIVVLANGATIYKFYNPGVLSGSSTRGKWRRI